MNKKHTVINTHTLKYSLLFLLATAHIQHTYTFFTGRISCFVAGNIYGIYAAYKHMKNIKETNNIQKESENKTFIPFMTSVLSDYPIIKDVIESADFKNGIELVKKHIQEK